MDSTPSGPASLRLHAIIAQYLDGLKSGRALDRHELVARNPDLAEELWSFFDSHDVIQKLADPDSSSSDAPGRNANLPDSLSLEPHLNRDIDATIAPTRSFTVHETPTISPNPPRGKGPAPLGRVQYFGDYELLLEVARGGMGVVYKARQRTLNRVVAIKMILSGQLASPEDVQRFYSEAESAASLDHPGIVPIYEVGQHEGQHYFSMGFVEGRSLAAHIAVGLMAPAEAAELMIRITEAIAYAHSRGVIHRDLKPANILLDKDGAPKVTDFGLAKKIETESGLTHTGAILGTPSYMPPEQAAGKTEQVGTLADVYSLGAILYCLLTGRPPFQASSPVNTILQVLNQEPVAPRQLNPSVPRDLETICLKCLSKEPHRRYTSAQELADDLERFLNDEPIVARPIGALHRGWRWCRRNSVVASLATGVAATLIIGAIVSTFFAVLASQRLVVANGETARANREADDAVAAKNREEQEKQRAVNAERAAEDARREAEIKRNLAERKLYVANMRIIQQAMREGELTTAIELLEAHEPRKGEPDLRGWEWFYWRSVCEREVLWTKRVVGPSRVVWNPQQDELAVTSQNGTVSLYNSAGDQIRVFKHGGWVRAAAFSADGLLLAAAGADGHIVVWETASGAEKRRIRGHAKAANALAFHPGGQLISAGSDGLVKIWDLASQGDAPLRVLPLVGDINCIALSSEGKWLAAATHEKQIKVWSFAQPEDAYILPGHLEPIFDIAWNESGSTLASMGWDGYRLWDHATRAEIERRSSGWRSPGRAIAWRGNDELTTGFDDRSIQVWSKEKRETLKSLRIHANFLSSLAWNARKNLLASADHDGRVRVSPVDTSAQALSLDKRDSAVWQVAFSPLGDLLAAAGQDSKCRISDVATGRTVLTIDGYKGIVRAADWHPDGTRLAVASYDPAVKIHDPATGKVLVELEAINAWTSTAKWNPAGTQLASSGWDGTVKIHDAATGKLLKTIAAHTGRVDDVTWDPGGRIIASAGYDNLVRLWDAASGKEIATFRGHTTEVSSVVFSPDGLQLASGGGDGHIFVWDVAQRHEPTVLRGHVAGILQLQWHRDGSRLASASNDQTWKVWDLETRQEVLSVRDDLGLVLTVAWSKDGHRLAAAGQNGIVKLWDASAGYERYPSTVPAMTPVPERVAELLVQTLFNHLHLRERVLAALRSDERIEKPVLAEALKLAEARADSPAAILALNSECWRLVSLERRTADEYRYAAELGEALAASTDDPDLLNTVGMARYRVGRFAEAVTALARSERRYREQRRPTHPANLAFLALSRQRLGEKEAARKHLADLQRTMQQAQWISSAEFREFYREADWGVADWQPLAPQKYTSSGGAALQKLDDGSLLASGTNPPHDTYQVHVKSPLAKITALRLDVLRDERLPGKGPGRHPDNGTFALRRVEANQISATGSQPVKFRHAVADFSQYNASPLNLLSQNPTQGWSIWRTPAQRASESEIMLDQSVVLELAEPFELAEGDLLEITLLHGPGANFGRWPEANLGRFRLSASGEERPPLPPPNCDLRPELAKWELTPRIQGTRFTTGPACALTSALELALARKTGRGQRLSVEHIQWSANSVLGAPADRRHSLRDLFRAAFMHGICTEERMPYLIKFEAASSPSAAARDEAHGIRGHGLVGHWLTAPGSSSLTPEDIVLVKHVLADNFPVCAGPDIPMLLVGYRDDPQLPGGGAFLASDSARGDYREINYLAAQIGFSDLVWVHYGALTDGADKAPSRSQE